MMCFSRLEVDDQGRYLYFFSNAQLRVSKHPQYLQAEQIVVHIHIDLPFLALAPYDEIIEACDRDGGLSGKSPPGGRRLFSFTSPRVSF